MWGEILKWQSNQKGFGIVVVIVIVAIIAIALIEVTNQFNVIRQNNNFTKTAAGSDSLASALVPILTEENLCASRLPTPPLTYNVKLASNGVAGTTLSLPISFLLPNPKWTQKTIGTATPTFFPQFGSYLGALYFANAVSNGTEKSNDLGLQGSSVYQGHVYITLYQAPTSSTAPATLAGYQPVASTFYVWVKAGKIVSCGIVKTPAQFCMDDLGGTSYTAGAAAPCLNPKYPCPYPNYYFLGYLGPNNTNPQCVLAPSYCPANQTVVSTGTGGMQCVPVP